MAPSPKPPRKRSTMRTCKEDAKALAKLKMPNAAKDVNTTVFRPILSARGPIANEPTVRPAKPAPKILPISGPDNDQVFFKTGATKAGIVVSKPSIVTTAKHRNTESHW